MPGNGIPGKGGGGMPGIPGRGGIPENFLDSVKQKKNE